MLIPTLFLLFLYNSCDVNLKCILSELSYIIKYLLMTSITHITKSKFSKVKKVPFYFLVDHKNLIHLAKLQCQSMCTYFNFGKLIFYVIITKHPHVKYIDY